MTKATQIREHMKVIGSDGQHVGTVDGVEGDKIILTKSDPTSGGQHHALSMDMVDNIGQEVRLNLTADEARRQWQASGPVQGQTASGGISQGTASGAGSSRSASR